MAKPVNPSYAFLWLPPIEGSELRAAASRALSVPGGVDLNEWLLPVFHGDAEKASAAAQRLRALTNLLLDEGFMRRLAAAGLDEQPIDEWLFASAAAQLLYLDDHMEGYFSAEALVNDLVKRSQRESAA